MRARSTGYARDAGGFAESQTELRRTHPASRPLLTCVRAAVSLAAHLFAYGGTAPHRSANADRRHFTTHQIPSYLHDQRDNLRDGSDWLWYNWGMTPESSVINKLLEPVGECFTPEVAQRIAELRADASLQAHVDALADKANAGTLTDTERSEYERYISFSEFVTLLQVKARDLLDRTPGAA